jgi:beta-glucosidase
MSQSIGHVYRVLLATFVCGVFALPNALTQSVPHTVDSETFLHSNMTPAGPAASDFSARVNDLLREMTRKEKIGQMTQLELSMITTGKDQDVRIDPIKLHKAIVGYGVGSILNVNLQALPVEKWQSIIRAIQSEAQQSRLKIPVLYGLDSIHGANYVLGATIFPQPLGMAATWNPELVLESSRISAAETRKAGVPWVFSPVLGLGRQPLWPRLYETYGEDTYLTTVLGVAAVRGYEGTNLSDATSVAASLKHYIGYSDPTNGGDRSPALIPERELREYYMPSFAAAVKAGGHTVMVNSSEVNGIPGHANKYLLTNVLRGELGFEGMTVSDWGDIKNLVSVHHVAPTEKDATSIAIQAGIDMSMVPSSYSFSDLLLQLVQNGKVPMSRVDDAVRRILTLKYQLGLIDDPMRGVDAHTVIGASTSRRINLEAARESITLLKDQDHTLPLSKSAHVLVTGPDAESLIPLDNGWTYTWQGGVENLYPRDRPTILRAIQDKIGASNVTYVPGATFDKEIDISKAVAAAAEVDAIVACIGEWSYAETPGNIADLTLPDAQLELVKRLEATKKPVILVLTEGRPRIIRTIVGASQGILMAYNPGNEGGQAVADILFGDVNPSGKLPITYPRWDNRLFTYDHKYFSGEDTPEGRELATPEFEFGYGLSYTTFAYSELKVSPAAASGQQHIRVTISLKNTGSREGKEVVELYLSKRSARVTPPLKRLKRFAKIDLEPGKEQRVSFELTPADLTFIGLDNRPVIEPGTFDVHIGGMTQSFEWR